MQDNNRNRSSINNQNHKQQQQLQVQRQIQGELQYTVYKDVENFLGILVESNTVCQELDKDDPLINIHINRLIAQLNLSKSIHYDTQKTEEDNRNNDQLSGLKLEALNIIQQYLQVYKIQIDSRIEQYFKDYKDVLMKRQNSLSITKLIPTNRINNLQEQQITNLLNSMNSVDQDYQNMRNGQQYKLDKNQLFKRIDDRIGVAQAKLKGYKQSSSSNQKQKNSKQQQEDEQEQQEQQEQQEKYSLSKESIQMIRILIKISQISQNENSKNYINELKQLIQNITSQKSSSINTKKEFQNYNKQENKQMDKFFEDIQRILGNLTDKKKAGVLQLNIKNYFQNYANPYLEDWLNKFDKKDIKIIEDFIQGSK